MKWSEDSESRPVDETSTVAESDATSWGRVNRVVGALASWPVIVLSLLVTVVGIVVVRRTAPCSDFHFGAQFSGSDDRLKRWIGSCGTDLGEARSALLADGLLIAGYTVAAAGILGRWWRLYQAPRLKQLERVVILLPFIAAAFDIFENAGIWAFLDENGQRYSYPSNIGPTLISTLAWLKMLTYGAAALCLFSVVLLAIAQRRERDRIEPEPVPDVAVADLDRPSDLGVCCSGGGIRAAAFALGAIESLESKVMPNARYLASVSGGNYAATAWTLARASDPSRPVAGEIIAWLNTPIPYSNSPQHRFLRNGPGGLGRSMIAALMYIALNVVVLGALVAAIAWPVGWLIGSKAIQGQWRALHGIPASLHIGSELWLPGVIMFGFAALVFLASALPSWRVARIWRAGAILVLVGVALELLTVGVPAAMHFVSTWGQRSDRSVRATTTSAAAVLGALAAVWRIARKPVMSKLSAKLPYLGGVLLALAALVWAGKVATDAATATGLLPSLLHWLGVLVGFAIVYVFLGMTQPSIHRIYRKRLRRTFGVGRDESGRLFAPHQRDQITWDQLPDTSPELIVCCAHQRDGIAPGGLPADSFTISRTEVCIGNYSTPTRSYLARLPADLVHERAVSSWMATSGAAFASAMGRLSRGTTNALMAALNIDLGIWLPNPRLTPNPEVAFPKVRFGYLFKEILGWYDDSDRYVFIADGGHWDNLGLVELLRRRCELIICLDASGDDVGKFSTLHQAVELAGLELPEIVASIDLDPLDDLVGADGALPSASVTKLRVRYTSPTLQDVTNAMSPGPVGTIIYAKAQLAADLDIDLRRFAKADPKFPNYSTAKLFLGEKQFDNLVKLGRAAGLRVKALYDEVTQDTGPHVVSARVAAVSEAQPA